MSPPDGSNTLTLSNAQTHEERMRTALGFAPARSASEETRPKSGRENEAQPTAANPRRPFEASDSLRARLATIESALAAERSERIAAQRALADAQTTIQQLQTTLAHNEMAAAEALAAGQQALLSAQATIQELTHLIPPALSEAPVGPKKRGRPPGSGKKLIAELHEPEPVKWWLPSYKASKSKRTLPSRS